MRSRQNTWTIRRALVASCLVFVFARPASADPESVRVEYDAPPECLGASAFLRSIAARTTRFRQAEPGEHVRLFSAHLSDVDGAFAGRLEIRSLAGRSSFRTVGGPACQDVSEALALIVALAIDPDAIASSPKGPPDAPQRATPAPGIEAEPERSRAEEHVAVPASPVTRIESRPRRWATGGAASTVVGVSPGLGYGGDLFVDTETNGDSAFVAAVRIGIFFNQSGVEWAREASARFRWMGASLAGTPVRVSLMDGGLAFYPCLRVRLGILHGESVGISRPAQTTSFWADVGPALRARMAVAPWLFVEVEGGLVVPLTRPTFEILDLVADTPKAAYSVAVLGASAGIGVLYRFR